ncbi:MAG: hypothetical protein LBT02_00680 [Rickettsiales bacterium]|jgi:hypothetical protein|nr:hypothetical protein [Rickettsiales bacterium]
MKKLLLFFAILILPFNLFAAVGCDLKDPDRDVKRFFPLSTGYKTNYYSIKNLGGENLLKEVETELGDKFTGLYETIDVPYTIYSVYKDKAIIGYIHGINQKGKYGGIQVFLVYNSKGAIQNFYYQKLTSRSAEKLKGFEFANKFTNLTYKDFKNYDPVTHQNTKITNPDGEETNIDFYATLRAVKKNLILMKKFIFK